MVMIKAAFAMWLPHGIYRFSGEDVKNSCYPYYSVISSNLLFLEISTKCSENHFLPEETLQRRSVTLRGSEKHRCNAVGACRAAERPPESSPPLATRENLPLCGERKEEYQKGPK